jgi:hypothetical protein
MKIFTLFSIIAVLIFSIFQSNVAYSGEIELIVKDFNCGEDGRIVIHYGLKSTYDFDYPNAIIGFKIMENEKVIVCKELTATVPKGSDGSETKEIVIEASCSGKDYSLKSIVFNYVKRYKIDEWFSDCSK